MIDIEKIKAEFSKRLIVAERSNELEKKTGLECSFYEHNMYGAQFIASYGSNCNRGAYFDKDEDFPTIKDAAKLLTLFKPTGEIIEKDKDWSGKYRISTSRGLKDLYGAVEIMWIHNDILFSFSLCIEKTEQLRPFFITGSRRVTESELSTYHPVNSNGLLDRNKGVTFYSFLNVSGNEQTAYYGGRYTLRNNDVAMEIINVIINEYDKIS